MRETMTEVLEEHNSKQQSVKTMQFSKVGSTMAATVYSGLGITMVNGNEEAPIPDNASYPHCGTFPMHQYADEKSATSPFLDFIKKGLVANGVTFGRGGFSLSNVHTQPLYELPVGKTLFKGGMDGAITPFAVHPHAPTEQLRAAIELKHSGKHKGLYKEHMSNVPLTGDEQDVSLDGSVMGQAMIEALAAYVFAEYPSVMLLVSSFDTNAIFHLEGCELTCWDNLSFDQAMFKLARYLTSCDTDRHYSFLEKRSQLPELQVERVERIRKKLKPTNMMLEQLESVVGCEDDPEARAACAYEIIQAHTANRPWPCFMYT
jgi:hypothetical protein